MVRDWESQFREWAKPPGKTEEDRCANAITAIRNAIKASDKLKSRGVSVLVQGSYKNNTNVRKDSDVDVGVVCTDTFFYDLPSGMTKEHFGITPATYHYAQFKSDLEEALVSYFGRAAVTRGNKAFDLHETSYHVEADVAPFFEHRHFLPTGSHLTGVELQTDAGVRIVNWPEQHYANGCKKNNDTGTRYKSIVRDLKALSVEMAGAGITRGDVPGFLIECLVWNVPNSRFNSGSYTGDVRAVLAYVYEQTKSAATCEKWVEVSELKYLFSASQKWTPQQANAFAVAAWSYAELGD